MLLAVKEIWNPETCACFTTENAAVIIAGSKIGMEIGMFQTDRRVDRDFYIMGWCAAGIFAALFLFVRVTGIPVWKFLLPCPFHALTGAYCPGCGGTRAVRALLAGKWLRSFVLHPFVPYAALLSGWFMISQTIERVSGSRIRIALRFRDVYIWIALLLIVVNCLVKNLALFVACGFTGLGNSSVYQNRCRACRIPDAPYFPRRHNIIRQSQMCK